MALVKIKKQFSPLTKLGILLGVIVVPTFSYFIFTSLAGTTISKTTTQADTLQDGLVGHWTFDGPDMLSNVADVSGQGNHGSLTNFVSTTTTPGKVGQALEFDVTGGTNDIVLIGSFQDVTSQYTISTWVKLRDDGDNNEYFVSLSNNVRLSRYNNNEFDCAMRSGGSWSSLSSSVVPEFGKWYNVTCVFDGTTRKIYIDSVERNSGAFSDDTTNSTLQFGWANSSASIGGSLDDVRIYNRALSADEVKQLYDMGL